MESSKYVVIGAGLMGSATAWHLASGGQEVTLLDRDEPAGPFGSSHGSARIFRYAYPQDIYAQLVKEAAPLWTQLERESDRTLFQPVGGLDFGSERDPAHLASVLDRVGVEHRLLGAEEARDRWPQYAFDTDVLWQPTAGVIDAESAVNAMVSQASAAGAQIETHWEVAEVREASTTGYIVLATDGREIHAAEVIVAAGGWLPQLLRSLTLPKGFLDALPRFKVRQEQVFHFPYDRVREDAEWPTLVHGFKQGRSAQNATERMIYALPGGRDAEHRGLKVALFNGGKVLSSAEHQDGKIDGRGRDWVIDYVQQFVPGVVPEPYAETTCLFTNTPTEDFIIERVDGITVVSTCSGHGAKFSPLIGLLAAGVATGNGTVPKEFRVPR